VTTQFESLDHSYMRVEELKSGNRSGNKSGNQSQVLNSKRNHSSKHSKAPSQLQGAIDQQAAHSSSLVAARQDSHHNSSGPVNRSALNIQMPGSHFAKNKDNEGEPGAEAGFKQRFSKTGKVKESIKEFEKLPQMVQDFNRDVLLGAQDNYEMLLKKQKIDQYIENYVQSQTQKKLKQEQKDRLKQFLKYKKKTNSQLKYLKRKIDKALLREQAKKVEQVISINKEESSEGAGVAVKFASTNSRPKTITSDDSAMFAYLKDQAEQADFDPISIEESVTLNNQMSHQMLENLKLLQITKTEGTNFNSRSDVNLKSTIFDKDKHARGY
jgi:hypothetical protein